MIISAMLASLLKAIMLTFYTGLPPPPRIINSLFFLLYKPYLHCKKRFSDFPVPGRDVTYQTLHGAREELKLFPATESLVSGILAGDWKTAKPFINKKITLFNINFEKFTKQG
jgi:hypothetical protein